MKEKSTWSSDLIAGFVVFLVALPLCLGIAMASTGKPELLFSGIIAGVIGGVVVGFLSNSALGVSGPAAGLATIIFAALEDVAFDTFLLAVVIAGLVQILAGFLKAGIIGYYFPSSVIKGMLAAIGITLILKEIPHILGYDKDFTGDMSFNQKDGHNTFSEIYYAIKYHSVGAIIISIISLAIILLFERPFLKKIGWMRFIPSALIIVILGILTNNLFKVYFPQWVLNDEHLVTLPVAQGFDDFVGFFTFPDFTQFGNPQVYIIAGTLALVASLETLLSAEATDKIDPLKRTTKTNRELKAQGIGNIVSGLIGGLPITQVVVRSSANIDAGGKSKKATIIHGAFLFLAVVLIAPILNQIPMSALGVVLLVVGYKLSKIGLYTKMYKLGWTQFIPFLVTVAAILFTDLLVGIGIGMVVAIYFILKNNYKFAYKLKKDIVDGKTIVRLSLSEEVTFLNRGSIQLTLDGVEPNSHVIIDGSNSGVIDYDVLEIIHNFKTYKAPSENITVQTINVPEYISAGGH